MPDSSVGQLVCSCPYPEPSFEDRHRACPLHGDEARLREALSTAREALGYVLSHHIDGNECVCPAARSVAESGLRLTEEASRV